jgi:hypothetical protein
VVRIKPLLARQVSIDGARPALEHRIELAASR